MVMRSPSLICTILVWVVPVLCFEIDDMSDLQKSDLANNLNTLMRHSGWKEGMHNVKILINSCPVVADPMSAILEAVSSDLDPIDESNVLERYKEIWTLLMCKYGDVIRNYKILVQRFAWVCRNERDADPSHQRYYRCFRSLLIKLHSVSPRFKCMQDALDLIYSMGAQGHRKPSVMFGTQKLAEFTLTVGPKTSSKLSLLGDNKVQVIDLEMKNITEHISQIYEKYVYQFTYRHCFIPKHSGQNFSAEKFHDDFLYQKINGLISQDTTLVEHMENVIDSYVNDIFGKWFYSFGFAYGIEGKVTIAIK